jgi:GntR family transcriptional repressor for pyruvate dehydrogenase complex
MREPIERRRVCELLAERLAAEIRDRSLRPGDPIPTERELQQVYGVGRSSVREALRILESRGLIRPSGRRVFLVADYGNPLSRSLQFLMALEEGSLRDLFEVRKILEVEAAALAAVRRTAEDLSRMARAIDEMVIGLASQDRYIAADLEFHLAVAAATANRMALILMHAIRDLLHRALASIYHIPGSPQRSIEQHRAILDAIGAGAAEAARQRMREHLVRVEGDIQDILSRTPVTA